MLHQYHQLEVPTLKGVCLFDLTPQIKALVLKAGIRWGPRSVGHACPWACCPSCATHHSGEVEHHEEYDEGRQRILVA